MRQKYYKSELFDEEDFMRKIGYKRKEVKEEEGNLNLSPYIIKQLETFFLEFLQR